MHTHAGDTTIAPTYDITTARADDLAHIPSIELAAARMLEGHAPASVLGETTSLADLESARARGHLWVARFDGAPVGFTYVKLLEPGAVHLDEIDVHPDHGRRGVGRRLVHAVCAWAAARGFDAVTLSTFRAVPWNMPFYASAGFVEVPSAALSPALRAIVADEARRGLDPARRVVMRRALGAASR